MQHLVIAQKNEISSTEKEVVGREETRMKETKRTEGRREGEQEGEQEKEQEQMEEEKEKESNRKRARSSRYYFT